LEIMYISGIKKIAGNCMIGKVLVLEKLRLMILILCNDNTMLKKIVLVKHDKYKIRIRLDIFWENTEKSCHLAH